MRSSFLPLESLTFESFKEGKTHIGIFSNLSLNSFVQAAADDSEKHSFANIEALWLDDAWEERKQKFFSFLHLATNLRALILDMVVQESDCDVLGAALKQLCKLQQIKLHFECNLTLLLLDALCSLSLQEIDIAFKNELQSATKEHAIDVCKILKNSKHSLISMRMTFYRDEFWETFYREFDELPNLICFELIVVLSGPIASDFCKALLRMPSLEQLYFSPASDKVASVFANHLRRDALWRLRKFSGIFENVSSSTQENLFHALRTRSRLRHFETLGKIYFQALDNAKLIEAGWMTRFKCFNYESTSIPRLVHINELRHEACRSACFALIASRYSGKCLTAIPKPLVVLIAKSLYDMRNDSAWEIWKQRGQKE